MLKQLPYCVAVHLSHWHGLSPRKVVYALKRALKSREAISVHSCTDELDNMIYY